MSDAMLHPLTLSIVIPAPSDTAALEETLVSVLENRPSGAEVVVALGCDYDDPWNIAEEVRFVRAPGAGLVGCTNIGIAASTGDVVHVLAAGWKATPGWTDAALDRFSDGVTGAVIPVYEAGARVQPAGVRFKRGGRRVQLTRPGRGTDPAIGADRRVGARRPRGPVVGPCLEAGFWRSDVVRDGGISFTTVCGERLSDADMAIGLAARGMTAAVVEESRVVAGAPLAREGGFAAGLHGERLFWRSLAGRSLGPALFLHAIEVLRHAVTSAPLGTVPMLVGRFLGVLQVGSYLGRYRELSALLTAGTDTGAAIDHTTTAPATTSIDEARNIGRTIRIDDEHALSGPRGRSQRPASTEPLRKSA